MTLNNRIKVVEVKSEEYKRDISAFGCSLFVTPQWTSAFSSLYEVVFYHFNDGETAVGKLSGIIRRGSKFGPFLYTHAGPALLEKNPDLYNQCLDALYRYGRKNRFGRIFLHANDQQYLWPVNAKGYQNRGYLEYVRHFDSSQEEPTFSKSVMYNVRKAAKAGATFHEEQSERILNRFYELLAETQRVRFEKHGEDYEPYPYDFLNTEIVSNLFKSGILKLYHVEAQGEVHCVRCALDEDKRMFGLMIASDAFAYKHGLHHFLQFHLISQLHHESYKYYNISGGDYTNNERGLSNYKESLGCSGLKVYRAYTYYLSFPWNLLNPGMKLARILSKKQYLNRIKKLLFRAS